MNQNNLMNQNNRLASWKDKVWQNNVKDKYSQQYNYGMGLMGMGNQNMVSGLDKGLEGFGRAASGLYGQSNNGTTSNNGTKIPSLY